MSLFSPLVLPSGAVVRNRIAKAAMEENMADADHAPSAALLQLYQRWADGGAGLIITGNVMVDGRAMTGPAAWCWKMIAILIASSPGRTRRARGRADVDADQSSRAADAGCTRPTRTRSVRRPIADGCAVQAVRPPKAMTEDDIASVIARFIRSAELAERAGFTGVQIHAAHGYLLSQFLSPLSNRRDDRWGGSLHNRARLLLEIVQGVRAAVSPAFAVAVKLNSADFQRGGFLPMMRAPWWKCWRRSA